MNTVVTLVAARALAAARSRQRPASPAALAVRLLPNYRVTPTIALLSDVLQDAIENQDRRYIVSCPPRTGKSLLFSVIGPLYALMQNKNTNIILACYGDNLAWESSHRARALIAEYSDVLGFSLRSDKAAVGRWLVDGHQGGLLAAGIMSGITGMGAQLLLLDDVVKNSQEADSAPNRRRILQEFRSVILPRLMPGGSILCIGSMWSEHDLLNTLLREESDTWTHINIPAVAGGGVPDALGREPGVAQISALGRTAEGFEKIRREVGHRTWAAAYLGVPSTLEGSLLKSQWLDDWRLDVAPPRPVATCVAIDPSDSGQGDAAGIVACSITSDGVVCLIADRSRPMTSAAWGREAVALAYAVGASQIVVEGYTSSTTYAAVVTEALASYRREHPDARPVRVSTWRGKGDALARSAPLLAAAETGRFRLAGHHPSWEEAACSWQSHQHQPDQVAATVIAYDVLTAGAGRGQCSVIAPPLDVRLSDRPGRGGQANVTSIEEILRQRRRLGPLPGLGQRTRQQRWSL